MNKKKIMDIVSKYNGKKPVYGESDCNLQFLEIYDPELYTTMYGRYTTVRGGARVAKRETGFSKISEYVEASDRFVEIDPKFARIGDIYLDNKVSVGICLGRTCTVMLKNEWATQSTNELVHLRFYRRV